MHVIDVGQVSQLMTQANPGLAGIFISALYLHSEVFSYIVCPSILNLNILKLHRTEEVKHIFIRDKLKLHFVNF